MSPVLNDSSPSLSSSRAKPNLGPDQPPDSISRMAGNTSLPFRKSLIIALAFSVTSNTSVSFMNNLILRNIESVCLKPFTLRQTFHLFFIRFKFEIRSLFFGKVDIPPTYTAFSDRFLRYSAFETECCFSMPSRKTRPEL